MIEVPAYENYTFLSFRICMYCIAFNGTIALCILFKKYTMRNHCFFYATLLKSIESLVSRVHYNVA